MPELTNIFPNTEEQSLKYQQKQCKIIISSRVHPAESASSFVLEGFLNYFANNQKESEAFLKKCSIGVVPMLNPDGVQMGLTRTDSNGVNLNRVYSSANLETPSIYALKKLIRFFS